MKDDLSPLLRLTPLRRRRPKFMQIPSDHREPARPRHQTRRAKRTAVRVSELESVAVWRLSGERGNEHASQSLLLGDRS